MADDAADQRGLGLGLRGRRILVTGGSRGLGRAVALRLVAEGCLLAVCARGAEGVRDLAELARERWQSRLITRTLDVAEPGLLEEFVRDAAAGLGGLDGVVACAGGASGRALEEATPADWTRTWELRGFLETECGGWVRAGQAWCRGG